MRNGPTGPKLRCAAGTVTAEASSPNTLPDSIGIQTRLNSARVDYVVIYTSDAT